MPTFDWLRQMFNQSIGLLFENATDFVTMYEYKIINLCNKNVMGSDIYNKNNLDIEIKIIIID